MRMDPPVSRQREDPAARHIPPDAVEGATGATLPLAETMAGRQHISRRADWRVRPAWLREALPFLGILVIATYFLTINVATPWQSIHEDNGTLNESIALNHIRYGLGVTKGQDLLDIEAKQSFGPQHVTEQQHFAFFLSGPTHPEVYGDHPPLLGLTIAAAFLALGLHFWVERLVPILYSLIGLILFMRLVLALFDANLARFAGFLYATFPMLAYFGRNVSHEAPTLCWALVLLTGYVHWRQHQRRRDVVWMVIGTVIGGLYGWPLFYFAAILWAVDAWSTRQPSRALALATLLPAGITLALVFAQLAWALGGNLGHLSDMFLHRVSGGGETTAAISTIDWLHQMMLWNAEGFGGWSQFALPAALALAATRMVPRPWPLRWRVGAILGLWGLSHILIFRNGAFVHAYWQFYWLPFIALAVGWRRCGWPSATSLCPKHARWCWSWWGSRSWA